MMVPLSHMQSASLKQWFLPDEPGLLLGLHALQTGHGRFFADQWPEPRAVLVAQNENNALVGDPWVLSANELRQYLSGVVDAPHAFVPLLREAFPELHVWERIAFSLVDEPATVSPTPFEVQRLSAMHAESLASMSEELWWIHKSWGGAEGLANSGFAWAAFSGGHIISVACSFFLGEQYEEIGVVTEAKYRRRGLGAACAHALCQDIIARGRRPSWSTGIENNASIGVAEKLGFQFYGYDKLYVVNGHVPT